MITSLVPKRKHRHVLDLQLTAMIDIFSLIVIFLIKGTVFGVSDLPMDPTIKLPESRSKESLETAPQVQIIGDRVFFSGDSTASRSSGVDVNDLARAGTTPEGPRERLGAEIKDFISRLTPEARGSGVLLSVIADRTTPYSKVFQVVRFFRESGFDSILFVAAAEAEK